MKRRMIAPLAALLACTFCMVPAKANDTENFDLGWWAAMSDDAQLTAVSAAVNAYTHAYRDGYIDAAIHARKKYHSTQTMAQVGSDPGLSVTFSKSFGEYQTEVTQFYNMFADARSKATLGDILACLSDRPTFTCAQVAKFVTE